MKELGNKLVANLHLFILLWGLYSLYDVWEINDAQIQEATTRAQEMEAQLTANKAKLSEIEEFIKKADEYKVRVESVAKNIETVQRQLPAETNDSQILTFFSSEMNTLNMKDLQLNPGKEDTQTYFISKDYTVKAKGTFLQFLILFERIGNANRIYNVKSLKMIVSTESKKGRFQMVTGESTIQAFRFNPEFKVDRGFTEQQPAPTP